MNYVISLKLDEEKREQLNKKVNNMANDVIIGLGYILFIFVIGTIYKIIGQGVDIKSALKHFVIHSSPIMIISCCIDEIDKWLSLKWNDIKGYNKKKILLQKAKKSLSPIFIMIFNFIVFWLL